MRSTVSVTYLHAYIDFNTEGMPRRSSYKFAKSLRSEIIIARLLELHKEMPILREQKECQFFAAVFYAIKYKQAVCVQHLALCAAQRCY